MRGLVYVAFLSIVILALGCVSPPKPTTTATTLSRAESLQQDSAFYRAAVSSSDISKCNQIAESRIKDICVRDIAVSSNKVNLCKSVAASDLKDTCYYKIAIKVKDKSLCNSITRDNIKQSCISNA
ncbi:MAG: hypothetical protein V1744_07710 [Candidatus Altiarchaeota archaeon]